MSARAGWELSGPGRRRSEEFSPVPDTHGFVGVFNRTVGICAVFIGNITIAVLHRYSPKLDYVSLGFLEAALIPAYALFLAKFKVSKDGFEIVALDVVEAATKATGPLSEEVDELQLVTTSEEQRDASQIMEERDPRKAVVSLAELIKSNLSSITTAATGSTSDLTPSGMLAELSRRHLLTETEALGFSKLIRLGTLAASGAEVTPEAGAAAKAQAQPVIQRLTMAEMSAFVEAEISRRAARDNHKVELPAKNAPIDLVVDDVVIEVTLNARPDRLNHLLGQILRARGSRPDAKALAVFASRVPDNYRKLLAEQKIAVAWIVDDYIDGDDLAKQIAPWLFKPAAFPLAHRPD